MRENGVRENRVNVPGHGGIVRAHVQAVLPDYDIGAELGQGGFGRVLAGRHRRLDRPVAIKVLELPAADPAAVADVDAEAQIIARLDHPHIVRVYDYIRTPELALIVMELLPGGTLTRRAAEGLTPADACAVVAAVAVALDRVHREGLLHRDIKPSNILFAADGSPRLTDFGIARLLEATGAAEPTSVIGSTPYLAPEQFDLAVPGVGVDVYSLGAVLYELLAGTPPFGVDRRPHVMAERHRRAAPRPLPSAVAGLGAVTMRALAKHPADRQPGALAFAEELVAAATWTFGPDWLAASGISFRGDEDLRQLAGSVPVTPTRRYPPDRPLTTASWGWRSDPPVPPGGPPAGRGGWVGWSATVSIAVAVVVVAVVVMLLLTGVLQVGRGGDTPTAAPASSRPPAVYPVSAPVPLRGLISLTADATAVTSADGGGVYLSDSSQHAVTRFDGTAATTVVGRVDGADRIGQPGQARDEPTAVAALHRPAGVAAAGGSVFVADEWNCVVRRVYRPAGQPWRIETVAGRPAAGEGADAVSDPTASATGDPDAGRAPADICPRGGGDGPRGVGAQIGTPSAVAVGPGNALYIATGYAGQVWRIDPGGGSGAYRSTAARLIAGDGAGADGDRRATRERSYSARSDRATEVALENAYSVAVDGAGRVFVLSYADGYARIHLVTGQTITTLVQQRLDRAPITTLAPDPDGNGVLYTEPGSRSIRRLTPTSAGTWDARTLVTGTCVGDTERLFSVAVDRGGDLYYSCNDATQASVYRVTARILAAAGGTGSGTGPGQRVLY
ncbi:Protein kinase family protein [Frankia canadensis]|uniref:Protein kinase family protein n=1 Tax=Frankia canadensis TaxID=1836972 RepID=A0A2I2KMS1_9ACTN|nr:serine/threonine-protein kinase [Frankia canadensis]SNQ46960.1 Protein kinase family protein [Frankia canadensis]SOU54250.1 Protein kinase family protein [Frankia canadensis]